MKRDYKIHDQVEPIGMGAWALIPVGLCLVGVIAAYQYGMTRLWNTSTETVQELTDTSPVRVTQGSPQRETVINSIGMSLTRVPAGEFQMALPGATVGAVTGEPAPQQRYVLRSFYLGTHEVTNKQYFQVMKSIRHRYKPPMRPVAKVTWIEATEFCRRLSTNEAEQRLGHAYRLPSELEWEYACRAGTTSAFSFDGPLAMLATHAWYGMNANGSTGVVGSRSANGWGLFDMHGNVWEWCADTAPDTRSSRAESISRGRANWRVRRGGSWSSSAIHCRSDSRRGLAADRSLSDVGFRVVCTRIGESTETVVSQHPQPTAVATAAGRPERPPDPLITRVGLTPATGPALAPVTRPPRPTAAATAPTTPPAVPARPTIRSRKYLINSIGMTMRRIEPGSWPLDGTSDERRDPEDAKPPQRIHVRKAFFIGIHEVTQEQFQAVMDANPSRFRGFDRPVESVRWHDAQRFCEQLSRSRAEQTADRRYRLPTEAEWEYCCRSAATRTAPQSMQQEQLNQDLWCANNSGRVNISAPDLFQNDPQRYAEHLLANGCQTRPVGQKRPNRWGLFDMPGNVWEWCADSTTDTSAATSPATSGNQRVIRGGSWYDVPDLCRPSSRTELTAEEQYDNVGFRVVCEQPTGSNR